MKDFRYVTEKEIAVGSLEEATTLAEVLVDNGYVVMLSREEKLYIVNYIWSERNSDRNDVCFQLRELVGDYIFNNESEEE